MARMSAHETVPGQASSSFSLILSMTSKPRRLALVFAFFSTIVISLLSVESNRMEPSHPCIRTHPSISSNLINKTWRILNYYHSSFKWNMFK
ncbi:hypothetical protein PR202_ga20740 [Eleusine coracana subsp. coracana]|uniref:Transmembrane protein n=1 Tax=Eleusine coracana subsp. coracana TaxID=191504 RepID=A0AAV5CZU0_ELECO|nr:hypothetical protein PR202_ga20740 [Eleusine coracana subsp. coracana]